MPDRLGIPQRLRTATLVCILLLLHVAVPDLMESLRLFGLRFTVFPLRIFGLEGERGLAVFTPEEFSLVASGQAGFRRRIGDSDGGARLLPVLDLDLERGFLILGGGRNRKVRRDALVYRGGGCLGVVDRVDQHLSRVRLLHARNTSLPVKVEDPKRNLPGGLDVLHGVVVGDGKGAYLSTTFLARDQRGEPGDRQRMPRVGPGRHRAAAPPRSR